MRVNLADWAERVVYFTGQYYELQTLDILRHVLLPGDTFVDVGANIGMITLEAAHIVGESGMVFSFEPNPECSARLEEMLSDNGIGNVTVVRSALGSAQQTLVLHIPIAHSGCATLGAVETSASSIRTCNVTVDIGDEVLRRAARRIAMIKIDTEGFEDHVLSGLAGTIQRDKPLLFTEIVPEFLLRCGSAAADIVARLNDCGYVGYLVSRVRRGLGRRTVLIPIEPKASNVRGDVLWCHGEQQLPSAVQMMIR